MEDATLNSQTRVVPEFSRDPPENWNFLSPIRGNLSYNGGVKFLSVLLALLVLVGAALAQGPPHPPQNLGVTVTIAKPVAGLKYNATIHQQEADFGVSVGGQGSAPPNGYFTYS